MRKLKILRYSTNAKAYYDNGTMWINPTNIFMVERIKAQHQQNGAKVGELGKTITAWEVHWQTPTKNFKVTCTNDPLAN